MGGAGLGKAELTVPGDDGADQADWDEVHPRYFEEIEEAGVAVLGFQPALALGAQPADFLARDHYLAHIGVDFGLAAVAARDADDGVDVVGDAALDHTQKEAALGEGRGLPNLLGGSCALNSRVDIVCCECFHGAKIVHGARIPASNFSWAGRING